MNDMTYPEFKTEMARLLARSFKYTPNQIGFEEGVSAMVDLADAYPEFDSQLENE